MLADRVARNGDHPTPHRFTAIGVGNEAAAADMSFMPALTLTETGGVVRLELGGFVRGQGRSLQEAADELIARVLELVLAFLSTGPVASRELPADLETMNFLHELGELAASGRDIRSRIFS